MLSAWVSFSFFRFFGWWCWCWRHLASHHLTGLTSFANFGAAIGVANSRNPVIFLKKNVLCCMYIYIYTHLPSRIYPKKAASSSSSSSMSRASNGYRTVTAFLKATCSAGSTAAATAAKALPVHRSGVSDQKNQLQLLTFGGAGADFVGSKAFIAACVP